MQKFFVSQQRYGMVHEKPKIALGLLHYQDHFPLWFRGIHIVNVPRFGEMVFRILKPMLHQRVRDTIVFHQSLQSLHNHVDRCEQMIHCPKFTPNFFGSFDSLWEELLMRNTAVSRFSGLCPSPQKRPLYRDSPLNRIWYAHSPTS